MNSDFNLAVHALVYLDHRGETVSSEALAENICTNPARVRKVMSLLSRRGMVSSREGLEGGYRIEVDAAQTTLSDVAQATGVAFVKAAWRSGDPDKDCEVSSGMGDYMDGLYAKLDGLCEGYLATISIRDVEATLFSGSKHAASSAEAGAE